MSRRALWRTIRELKEEDVTFLLTTHYMEEAEELCDMIYIMNRGKIVARGSPMELKKSIGEDVVTIKSRPGRIDVIKPNLEKLAGVSSCKVVRDMFMITMRDKELDTILDVFKRHREKVISIEVTKPSLEDVFIHVTGEEWH